VVEAPSVRLPAEEVRALAERALLASGALAEVAELVAAHVVDAELAGHPSHGLRQIPVYCANAGSPGNDLTVLPEITDQTQSLTTIDAHAGLGHPALALAVDSAAAGAREAGIAAAAVICCGHAGRAGAWVERGAAQGCVTIVLLGGTTPPFAMVAAPGATPALHTNPIAVGAPASGSPLLLDIATSMVAAGKVPIALARGGSLPEGAIATVDGRRSGDPAEIARGGALLPVGGHKGFGLSALVEALSVSLTGADGAGCDPQEGALVICVDTAAFRPTGEVVSSLDALRARLRDSSGPGVPVLAPGDPEAGSRSAAAGSVDVARALVAELSDIASRATPREDAGA
jgi:LDH2 family malate/lactate/ureidoglycolate dehydrogenase